MNTKHAIVLMVRSCLLRTPFFTMPASRVLRLWSVSRQKRMIDLTQAHLILIPTAIVTAIETPAADLHLAHDGDPDPDRREKQEHPSG